MIKSHLLSKKISNLSESMQVPTASLWDIENPYSYIPILNFTNLSVDRGDKFYHELANTVSSFQGNLQWGVVESSGYSSYSILPLNFIRKSKILSSSLGSSLIYTEGRGDLFDIPDDYISPVYNKEDFLRAHSLKEFESIMDQVILDSPKLSQDLEEWGARNGG